MPSRYKRKQSLREPYKKIVIAMEGNKTEPKYFNAIKNKLRYPGLNIVLLDREIQDNKSAPIHVIDQLHKYKKKNRIFKEDEFWLVIDRDTWPENQLSEVQTQCTNSQYSLAVSNPCFEIWLIFHFEDLAQSLKTSKDVKTHKDNLFKDHNISSYYDLFPMLSDAINNSKKNDNGSSPGWPQRHGTRVYLLVENILSAK